MQIGKEHLAFTKQRVFWRLWFRHFHDHLGAVEQRDFVTGELGTRFFIVRILKPASHPRSSLDQNHMASVNKLPRADRSHPDPELLILDLFRHPYDHGLPSASTGSDLLASAFVCSQEERRFPLTAPTAPVEDRKVPSKRLLPVSNILSS